MTPQNKKQQKMGGFAMNYQQQPQEKGAGCLAVIISTVIVYKVAYPFSDFVQAIMDHEGIKTGQNILGLGSFVLLWMGLSWLVQFILDEFIAKPTRDRLDARQAQRRYILLIDGGKKTSSGKKWFYALLLLGGLWLFWK
jgi:hypothetical protein